MDNAETALAMAERHVREFEEIVDRQVALIEKLEADGNHEGAKRARTVLATFVINLEFARDHLRLERDKHSTQP